jgi:predicted MPP superfamily phosphohydrolase
MPGTVNIVLNHNPNDFDHAVDLGIDLMPAGHTHGGQLSLVPPPRYLFRQDRDAVR